MNNIQNDKSILESSTANTETVYHGTTFLIDKIDVAKGKPYKDFGRGFYVTKVKQHAEKMALRNKRIEKERYSKNVEAYLYTYSLDISRLQQLNVKEFKTADMEWLQFVLANRKERNRTHSYDVVIGPTANDDTMLVINAYLDGLYGKVGEADSLNTLLKYIEAEKLPGQIYFATNEATAVLTQIGQVEIL